jgi:hypothetical protein
MSLDPYVASGMESDRLAQETQGTIPRFLDSRTVAWVLGVVMPPVMVLLDPVVFRGSSFAPAFLGTYRPLGYVGIALGMAALVLVLTLRRGRAFLAGTMAAGSVFAVTLGIAILPASILGIILFGFGLLGLTPFLCAVLAAWWSRKSFQESGSKHRFVVAIAGFLVFAVVCVGSQLTVSRIFRESIDQILSNRLHMASGATERLRRWSILIDMDQFIPLWEKEADPERKERLADAYRLATGEDLEKRALERTD